MRYLVLVLLLAGSMLFGAQAWASEQTTLYCINMPWCCQFNCAMIDVECCGCGQGSGPLLAEFLDANSAVLGTATFTGDWCCGDTYGQLDKPVDANAVCSIRLVKPTDCGVVITWASLRVYCGDQCCGKWHKVFKGDIWCWQPVPAPAAEPAPLPAEPPQVVTPVEEPSTGWEPQPEPESEPAPEPEPEPEVIQVPGRG